MWLIQLDAGGRDPYTELETKKSSTNKLWEYVITFGEYFVVEGITKNARVDYVLDTLNRMIKVNKKWNSHWKGSK